MFIPCTSCFNAFSSCRETVSDLCFAAFDSRLLHEPSAQTNVGAGGVSLGRGRVFGPGVPLGIGGGRTRGTAGNEKGGWACAATDAIDVAILISVERRDEVGEQLLICAVFEA